MAFLDENFLLTSKTGKNLFYTYAKHQKIIDYHCHLDPKEIAENKRFSSITELWLGGDHYKWRAMRGAGIDESFITGDASDKEKFHAWAKILPLCIGNPLYHWTHLELQRYFNSTMVLNEHTAETMWNLCNDVIRGDDFSAQNLISKSNVEVICSTDDPCDTLQWHRKIREYPHFKTKVYPTFRPDKVLAVSDTDNFVVYVQTLAEVAGIAISSFDLLKEALQKRIQFFHEHGCRLSDHALSYVPMIHKNMESRGAEVFLKAMQKQDISKQEIESYQCELLLFLSQEYYRRNWTMQFHIGALRNVNPKMFKRLGADTGFDVITDHKNAEALAQLLGSMEENNHLSKTILYNLHPADNFIIGTMIGAFQSHDTYNFGKLQFGAGWWFNDQKNGMVQHLTDLGNLGVLGTFVGMLTDSRSFVSYPRHEYFRRIFCNLIGTWVDNGEYPHDETMLAQIIEGVCYNNAKEFFQF